MLFYDYGGSTEFPDFKVEVQMAYLDDDTGIAEMNADWKPYGVGLDRPTNSTNDTLHIALMRIIVYWVSGGEKSYALESIISDTQAIFNFGSARVTVDTTNPPEVIGSKVNAAAHWPEPVPGVWVTIEGWGFDPATVTVHLVRNKYPDIEVVLTEKYENLLKGWVNLSSGVAGSPDPTEPDWDGRAAVGYWTLKTRQENLFSSYLYNGFVVEYPKPNIEAYGNAPDMVERTAFNNQADVRIKVEGGPFINLNENPAIRLIKTDVEGEILDQVNGVVTDADVTVPAGSNGYATTGCSITATFNFTAASAGLYRLQVINTKEPTLIGHRGSDYSTDYYEVLEYRPIVNDIIVNLSPEPHTAYRNRSNPWAVTISGERFNTVAPTVEIYLCSAVVDELPAGNWVQGTVASVPDATTINGAFDVSTLPEGNYIVYVRNLVNGLAGWTAGAPLVVDMWEGIDSFVPDTGYGFYENYYDIQATINGYGLEGATAVTFSNGSVNYAADSFTVNDTYSISAVLNLINCPNGNSWTVSVEMNGGAEYFTKSFSVTLGPAVILPPSDTRYAIKISSSGGVGTFESYETTAQRAFGVASAAGKNEKGVFEVQGMGFPMAGSTTLRLSLPGVWSAVVSSATVWDRGTKTVKISSGDIGFPIGIGLCDISVERTGSGVVSSYPGRWELVNK